MGVNHPRRGVIATIAPQPTRAATKEMERTMGDRGNIVIQEAPGQRVYLYTHWRGSDIKQIAAKALARKQRWNDASYLARIVFCEMVRGREDEETGYGISTRICDNQHDILVIDCEKQVVRFENENGMPVDGVIDVPFEDFIRRARLKGEVG